MSEGANSRPVDFPLHYDQPQPGEKGPEPGWEAPFLGATQSPSLGKLVDALAKAQLEFTPILKESENPAFARGPKKSKYASLDSVINATRPALAKHGLVVFQLPSVDYTAKQLTMVTKLAHSSGEWLNNTLIMPAVNDRGFTAHSIGSAITYARRYAWQAVIGCVAEEDDDGNSASEVGSAQAAQEVGKGKLADKDYVASMFYTWNDESQTATISGAEELKTKYRKILKPMWSATAGAIVATGEQLEDLKYQFQSDGVLFKQLKS